ncbi:MAG: hypothetical protein RO257_14880 [Candidatus Kapabacteria bacterium]|jgi:peptidoglycan hydrolase CwlO-like protein|nr:hypothetical protein [Candidatus Kapabacteria bacterium]
MKFTKVVATVGVSSLILASSLSFTGCTPMITEQQMNRLQDLRNKEKQINAEISAKESEIPKIETEINARQSVLSDCNKDKDFIMQKLSQWPNVWPDYTPSK